MNRLTNVLVVGLLAGVAPLVGSAADAPALQSAGHVLYLGNEGVMIAHERVTVLFDPLFNESFGQYQLVPDAIRTAMFSAAPPFAHIDAVFVSHFHDDHFSPMDMLRMLRAHGETTLYAPAQAVAVMRRNAEAGDDPVLARISGLDLDYGDSPVTIRAGELTIEAVHVPHSGWPTARTDVQNIAFRVTFGNDGTVLHLGDADPRLVHFSTQEDYWESRQIDLALPPYWFFSAEEGVDIVENYLNAAKAIGIHVPEAFRDPGNIPAALSNAELFTRPGESRAF